MSRTPSRKLIQRAENEVGERHRRAGTVDDDDGHQKRDGARPRIVFQFFGTQWLEAHCENRVGMGPGTPVAFFYLFFLFL